MMRIELAVNGTLMRGLELNHNLLELGGVFVEEALTAPLYRLWSINDQYPAMQRCAKGKQISLEIWSINPSYIGELLSREPAGLSVGKILLADNREVLGILGESYLCEGKQEITQFGGWRKYKEFR
ncbi:MAG: glutamyl-tRNA amidotransferase [Gammaproteobacteria bacterium]|nr:MAG: glutamyl-tRNA amidotransferase [Gammaproteobacteria bacterium]